MRLKALYNLFCTTFRYIYADKYSLKIYSKVLCYCTVIATSFQAIQIFGVYFCITAVYMRPRLSQINVRQNLSATGILGLTVTMTG